MSRQAVAVFAPVLLAVASLPGSPGVRVAAAPVPKHLMPKDQPFSLPTMVGTTWVYDSGGQEQKLVISKVEDGKDGTKLVTTELVKADGTRAHYMTQSVGPKGIFLVAERGTTYAKPWCLFKLPHKEGDEWETAVRVPMTAGPAEKVKVPAGEIEAARVEWGTGKNRIATYWYAPGIGLVWMQGHTTWKLNWKLKSFTPGKE
jgi:hypothetical protein